MCGWAEASTEARFSLQAQRHPENILHNAIVIEM
jgi:hypothetical protein